MENKLENNSAEGKEGESERERNNNGKKTQKVESKTLKNVGLDDGNWL